MNWPRKTRDSVVTVILVAVSGLIMARCWSMRRPVGQPQHPVLSALCDFQDVVYYPAHAVLAGINPYDARPADEGGTYLSRFPAGNLFPLYSPLLLALSLPFALLPLSIAEFIFFLACLLLLLLYAYLLQRTGGFRATAATVVSVAAILLISRPGHASFYFGTIALPLVLATLGGWWFAERQPWLSAVCVTISLIKPTFGLPLLILLLVSGRQRAALFGLAIALVVNVTVLGVFLPRELVSGELLGMVATNQSVTDLDPAVDPFQSASRVDFPFGVERLFGRTLPATARYGMSLAMLLVAGWQLRQFGDRDQLLGTGFACLTIVLCIYHNVYDALLAAVSFVAAWRLLLSAQINRERWLAWWLLACLGVPAWNYLSTRQLLSILTPYFPSLGHVQTNEVLWTLLCVLNALALTIAWCLMLAALLRQPRMAVPLV